MQGKEVVRMHVAVVRPWCSADQLKTAAQGQILASRLACHVEPFRGCRSDYLKCPVQ